MQCVWKMWPQARQERSLLRKSWQMVQRGTSSILDGVSFLLGEVIVPTQIPV